MKNVGKRVLCFAAATVLLASSSYAEGFRDVRCTDWFSADVNQLVRQGGICGYDGGVFRPNTAISKAEFLSVLVKSMGWKTTASTAGFHWSQGVYKVAREKGLLKDGELNMQVDKPIQRFEMALLVSRALSMKGETLSNDSETYLRSVMDYEKIPAPYRQPVAAVVSSGIITGYTDKTFRGYNPMTRAEASAVMVRVLDASHRAKVVRPTAACSIALGETKLLKDFFISGTEQLNIPEVDINYKSVSLVSAEPYAMAMDKTVPFKQLNVKEVENDALMLVKDNRITDTVVGTWDPKTGITRYNLGDFKLSEPDYIAFIGTDETDLKMVINPFMND